MKNHDVNRTGGQCTDSGGIHSGTGLTRRGASILLVNALPDMLVLGATFNLVTSFIFTVWVQAKHFRPAPRLTCRKIPNAISGP